MIKAYAPPGCAREVVAWATRHARRAGSPLELLVDPVYGSEPNRTGWWTELTALGRVLAGRPRTRGGERLVRASAGAALLVVPRSLPDLPDVVAASYEPVVVVPPARSGERPRPGPVVVAVGPWTGDEVIAAAFAAAVEERSTLVVLRVSPVAGAGGASGSRALPTEDEVRDGEDAVSAWRMASPDVPVRVDVVAGDPVTVLGEYAERARLLVVGRSGRGLLADLLTPSPADVALRWFACPTLVVPAAGPPRRRWRPENGRRDGRATPPWS